MAQAGLLGHGGYSVSSQQNLVHHDEHYAAPLAHYEAPVAHYAAAPVVHAAPVAHHDAHDYYVRSFDDFRVS